MEHTEITHHSPMDPANGFWNTKWFGLTVIFLVVSAVMVPMAFMGIPDGYDLLQHLRFATTYHQAVLNGNFAPAWAASDNFGFGSVGIRYYPPLAYYLLVLVRSITGNWFDSFWITSFGWMLIGGVGAYFWAREWNRGWPATLAGVIYVIVPYHTFEIYYFVLYAEFAAAGILPFCFLFLTRMCTRRHWADVVFFAIAYSLLILTHIPSTIIASVAMAVYGLLILDWRHIKTIVIKLTTAFALALSATCFHWLKTVTEMNWVMHNSPEYFSTGAYDYAQNFFPFFLYYPPVKYFQKFLWQLDILIIISILFLVPTTVKLLIKRPTHEAHTVERRFDLALLATASLSIILLSSATEFFWKYITVLQKIQFPWRWLQITSLLGAVGFAVAMPRLIFSQNKFNRRGAYPILLFILLVLFFDITQIILPSMPLSRSAFDQKVSNIDNEEGCECWWPIWAKRGGFSQPERTIAGGRPVVVSEWQDESRAVTVGAGDATDLRFATFYHPYWRAIVNDEVVAIGKDENGVILVPLPAETSTVHLFFKEPRFLFAAKLVSLAIWLLFAAFIASYLVNLTRNRNITA